MLKTSPQKNKQQFNIGTELKTFVETISPLKLIFPQKRVEAKITSSLFSCRESNVLIMLVQATFIDGLLTFNA